MLTLTANGSNDITAITEWDSLQKSEGITKQPDTLTFSIKSLPGRTMPMMGEDILLDQDGDTEFAGTIVRQEQVVLGGVLWGYNYECKDKTYEVDRYLANKSYTNTAAGDIVADLISTYATTLTTVHVEAGPTITSIKFKYEQLSKCIERIASLVGYDWYVDYDGDVHFFLADTNVAPFSISDTSGKSVFGSLKLKRNILELKNRVVVRGGTYASTVLEANSLDKQTADGVQRVFQLGYRYNTGALYVKVNSTSKTVGIKNVDAPGSVDVLYDDVKRTLEFTDAGKPTAGQILTPYGDVLLPVIARVTDLASVTAYGVSEALVVAESANSIAEAQLIGKAQLLQWAEGASEGSFVTYESGLKTGMSIDISSTILGISGTYKINRIRSKCRTPDSLEHEVQFVASGNITFTDIMSGLLIKTNGTDTITDNEILQELLQLKETITITDSGPTMSTTTGPYEWGVGGSPQLYWNLGTWS